MDVLDPAEPRATRFFLEVELEAAVSHHMWIMWTEPRISKEAARALFLIFLIRYLLKLHFKRYTLSSFPLQKPSISSPSPCSTTALYVPDLAFPYTGALSLHRNHGLFSQWCLKSPSSATYVAGAMFFHVYSLLGSLVPGSSGVRVVHIIAPLLGLQTSSAPWVLSLVPPLGTLCSICRLVGSHGPPSKKDQRVHALVFPILELQVVC